MLVAKLYMVCYQNVYPSIRLRLATPLMYIAK